MVRGDRTARKDTADRYELRTEGRRGEKRREEERRIEEKRGEKKAEEGGGRWGRRGGCSAVLLRFVVLTVF